jgi:hypothetical protein
MEPNKRDPQRVRIPKLNSVARVGEQIGLLYRWSRLGKLDAIEAYRLVQILLGLKSCLETCEIERRLEQMEESLGIRNKPVPPPTPLRLIKNDDEQS